MRSQQPVLSQQELKRLHLQVQGMVQGIGFRPFVYRLAMELGLKGWVRNSERGVDIEIEGEPTQLTLFLEQLDQRCPPHAMISQIETHWLAPAGYQQFEICA